MTCERYEFAVDGPILGYRASAKRAFDPRYSAFKRRIRFLANVAGAPSELLDTDSAEVYVRIFWKKKARIDGSNVYKAVEDGLWKQDKQVVAGHFSRSVDQGKEYLEVSITVERR